MEDHLTVTAVRACAAFWKQSIPGSCGDWSFAYIGAMDVCVVPHSNEFRSPIKLFEYMGQAKLVVAPATEPVEAAPSHR